MAQENKNYMPQSTAGLIRYFEESKESIKIKPQHLLLFSVLIIIVELYLNIIT